MLKGHLFAAAALTVVTSSVRAAVISENFNTGVSATDNALVNNFNLLGAYTGSSWSSTGGLSNSGRVANPTTDNGNAVYKTSLGAFSTGATATASLYMQAKNNTGASRSAILGFIDDSASSFGTSAATNGTGAFLALEIQKSSSVSATYNLRTRQRTGGTTSTGSNNAVSLTSNAWYFVRWDVTPTATANTFDYVASIYNADSSGVVGTLVGSISASIVNASLYSDTSVYAGFNARMGDPGQGGIQAMDNFSAAVPEPAMLGLASLGGVAMLRRRRD